QRSLYNLGQIWILPWHGQIHGHSFCVYGLVPKLSKIMVPYRAWAVCTSRKKLDLEPFIGKIDIRS